MAVPRNSVTFAEVTDDAFVWAETPTTRAPSGRPDREGALGALRARVRELEARLAELEAREREIWLPPPPQRALARALVDRARQGTRAAFQRLERDARELAGALLRRAAERWL